MEEAIIAPVSPVVVVEDIGMTDIPAEQDEKIIHHTSTLKKDWFIMDSSKKTTVRTDGTESNREEGPSSSFPAQNKVFIVGENAGRSSMKGSRAPSRRNSIVDVIQGAVGVLSLAVAGISTRTSYIFGRKQSMVVPAAPTDDGNSGGGYNAMADAAAHAAAIVGLETTTNGQLAQQSLTDQIPAKNNTNNNVTTTDVPANTNVYSYLNPFSRRSLDRGINNNNNNSNLVDSEEQRQEMKMKAYRYLNDKDKKDLEKLMGKSNALSDEQVRRKKLKRKKLKTTTQEGTEEVGMAAMQLQRQRNYRKNSLESAASGVDDDAHCHRKVDGRYVVEVYHGEEEDEDGNGGEEDKEYCYEEGEEDGMQMQQQMQSSSSPKSQRRPTTANNNASRNNSGQYRFQSFGFSSSELSGRFLGRTTSISINKTSSKSPPNHSQQQQSGLISPTQSVQGAQFQSMVESFNQRIGMARRASLRNR